VEKTRENDLKNIKKVLTMTLESMKENVEYNFIVMNLAPK
jgi:hypothetical protein